MSGSALWVAQDEARWRSKVDIRRIDVFVGAVSHETGGGMKTRILHITVGLGIGGAEKIMCDLACGVDKEKYEVEVLSLKGRGPAANSILNHGIKLMALDGEFWHARGIIKSGHYDIIHAHCFWACVVACLFKGNAKVIWHEHGIDENMGMIRRYLERRYIKYADAIVGVCHRALEVIFDRHKTVSDRRKSRNLYTPEELFTKGCVIRNGTRTDYNIATESKKMDLKWRLYGFGPQNVVFGFVGRVSDPVKGFDIFKRAAKFVEKSGEQICKFVVIGADRNYREG